MTISELLYLHKKVGRDSIGKIRIAPTVDNDFFPSHSIALNYLEKNLESKRKELGFIDFAYWLQSNKNNLFKEQHLYLNANMTGYHQKFINLNGEGIRLFNNFNFNMEDFPFNYLVQEASYLELPSYKYQSETKNCYLKAADSLTSGTVKQTTAEACTHET